MTVSMAQVVAELEPQVQIDLAGGSVTVGDVTARHRERRDLVRDLGTFLYTHFHVGHHHTERLEVAGDRDVAYEEELCRRYADRSTTRRVPVIAVHEDEVVVEYLGLRVRAPRSAVELAGAVADLSVPLVSPALSPGFALARGPVDLMESGTTLRVYFGSAHRDHATDLFHTVLEVLRDRSRWHAKVASQQNLYPRSDAVTVYLDPSELAAVDDLTDATRAARADDAPQSRFTLSLGPGVGCAWNPDERGVSFGQHRARVLAQVLMARAEGSWDPTGLDETCRSRGIDPHHIWRNPASPDLSFLHHPVQDALATSAVGTP